MSAVRGNAQETALALSASGLSVIPIRADGSKAPALSTWKEYETRIPGLEEIRRTFRNGCGVGIIGGEVSGNLEILDVESGAPFADFVELVATHDPALINKLPQVETPSGGHHLFYRCDAIAGNQKLAMELVNGKPEVLFETRARGGYVVTVGSPPECHEDRKEYRLVRGSLAQIPRITVDQRSFLLDCARSFNRIRKRETSHAQSAATTANGNGNGQRPGDVFANQVGWEEILGPHGWVCIGSRGEETFWRRPGKKLGISASLNFGGNNAFYVFSTNAHPFEHETSYTKFFAYALLEHAGDTRAAARALAQRFGMKAERYPGRETNEQREAREEREAFQAEAGEERQALNPATQPEVRYIDFAPAFLAIEDPPIKYLIEELLPGEVIALTHGEPRTRKSWSLLELAISLTTGRPAFGLQRFAVPESVPVLYSSQEDGSRPVRERMKRLLRGYGLGIPEKLAFAVHKGIDLESPAWQNLLLEDIRKHGFKLVIFDPIRRFSESVDKGPAEVRKVTAFLRRLCIETGATIIVNHHDVKPSSEKPDTRRRSHKASGGDWFAASECPVAFEPAGENCSLVIPEDYKFSVDPKPFTFRIEEDPERTWARLTGEDASVEQAVDLAGQEKALAYLVEHKGASTVSVAKGAKMRKEDAITALTQLSTLGKVDCLVGGRGKATRWFLKEEKE